MYEKSLKLIFILMFVGAEEESSSQRDLDPTGFLRGYLKNELYSILPNFPQDLREKIINECQLITPEIFINVPRKFESGFYFYMEAQDPRKRFLNPYPYLLDELELNKNDDEDLPCGVGVCIKRSSGQDELGPFWANRGKKDPTYIREPLYADEPYWVLVRRDDHKEPFFTSRGKKDSNGGKYSGNNMWSRVRREFVDDTDSPFFAARGKKLKSKNMKL